MGRRSTVNTPAWHVGSALLILGIACSQPQSSPKGTNGTDSELKLLSDYGFFEGPLRDLQPAEGVIPYTVNSPLWADNAAKGRFIVLPPGSAIAFSDTDDWLFPLGTTLIKTFYFDLDHTQDEGPYRIVETRLLVLDETGWNAHIYVWNDEETEAVRHVAGADVWIDFIDSEGSPREQWYLVPNKNECGNCHERDDELLPLGPVARQLSQVIDTAEGPTNQLMVWENLGLFSAPLPDPESYSTLIDPYDPTGDLEWRARSWLDANCAHCHRPGSGGGSTGLDLRSTVTNPTKLGVCKSPVAAGSGAGGNAVDILPGQPDKSIMVFRISTLDPEIKMPELPNLEVDVPGVELIREWISAMEPVDCDS